ncbi:MAG: threonine/serine dehydratase [Acidobacteriota bacterium]
MSTAATVESSQITREVILEAHKRIRGHAHRTPVMRSATLEDCFGAEVYFKCENLQRVGAFKFRGGINAVSQLSDDELARGVTTHSSGNHAQALSLAARIAGTRAQIVMPENAPTVKLAAVRGYGAEVTLCEPTLAARESTTARIMKETGAVLVHPYDDERIIAGQATAAKELIEDTPTLDIILMPVGGGGLASGTALSAHYFSPSTRVIAIEPSGADDAYRSLAAGHIVPSVAPKTLADGLLSSLGQRNFPILERRLDSIVTVDDDEIIAAMRWLWERMKIVVEPSGAVPFAAVHAGKLDIAGQRVGIILTGGNVDLDRLPW